MKADPIVSEIHRLRKIHAKRFKYDVAAIFSEAREREAKHGDVVDLTQPKQLGMRVAEASAVYDVSAGRRH